MWPWRCHTRQPGCPALILPDSEWSKYGFSFQVLHLVANQHHRMSAGPVAFRLPITRDLALSGYVLRVLGLMIDDCWLLIENPSWIAGCELWVAGQAKNPVNPVNPVWKLKSKIDNHQSSCISGRLFLQKVVYLFFMLLCELVELQPALPGHQVRHERYLIAVGLSVIDQIAGYIGKMKAVVWNKYVN